MNQRAKSWRLTLFEHYFNHWGIVTLAELSISVGLGLAGLAFALSLKRRRYLKGFWYLSLRHILTFLSIAGLSNAWTILLLGYTDCKTTELLLNVSLLSIIGWVWGFYRFNLFKHTGPCSIEKILKLVHREALDNRSLSARTKRL